MMPRNNSSSGMAIKKKMPSAERSTCHPEKCRPEIVINPVSSPMGMATGANSKKLRRPIQPSAFSKWHR